MSVRVDISAALARSEAAAASLRGQQIAVIKEILDRACDEERRTHRYQNRTGEAERTTVIVGPVLQGDEVSFQFVMGVPYGVYLDARGFTRIGELAAGADAEIQAYLEAEQGRLAAG